MRFVSTNGRTPPTDLATAVQRGLAPDGGLYIPEAFTPFPPAIWDKIRGGSFLGSSLVLAPALAGEDLSEGSLRRLLTEAFDFPIPLAQLSENIWVLELFHGPTCAFKDVGARFLARLLANLHRSGEPLTILVATSGDTGSAVAQAFLGVPDTRVVVLYPRGQVSRLQEAQFATLGENVEALAVEGTFDDCQRLVKEAFADENLRSLVRLTSANSINVGRWLPQIFYYFHAVSQLPVSSPSVIFSTPSGNFGNLTAGLLAKRLGLKVARFVSATNINDTVPRYLQSGVYAPRPSVRTLSSAMDVGAPSNFVRMLALYGKDLEAMRRDVTGSRHDDRETLNCIREVWEHHGMILDPHSAVGMLGLEKALSDETRPASGILLATAHPGKFREVIEQVIGEEVKLPERLEACLERPVQVRTLAARYELLRDMLLKSA